MSRLSRLAEDQQKASKELLLAMKSRGPLWTAHEISQGNLGGPVGAIYGRLGGWLVPKGDAVWFTLVALVGPVLLGVLALWGTNQLLEPGKPGWQPTALVIGLVAVAAIAVGGLYMLAVRPTRGRLLRVVTGWSVQDLIWWGLLLFVVPTVAFAAGSALLVDWKSIGIKGVTSDAPNLAFKTCETYLWNLADAVPVLKIPETMAWKPQLRFTDSTGRGLVLTYKILLVLPFAQLVAIVLARSFGDDRKVDSEAIKASVQVEHDEEDNRAVGSPA